ncbi:MAG: pyridoxal phosphate-dependent aminotransferase [Chloroflexota bacterium]|nr:MAG: pyridoxal phosphate-dependent aminotransferase [Chloroflexota bacterium]
MHIAPFATEQYYALYEFSTPHMLSSSDCETMSVGEVLELAGMSLDGLSALRLGYTESPGHPELRAAVASGYGQISPEQVVVLTSPVEGIYLVMRALLEPGDEVVVLSPAYDALRNMAEHVAGRVQTWTLTPTENGWRLDLEALAQMVSERTKLVVVNFPNNPTGHLPTPAEFQSLIDLCARHGTWLFCDEMYRGLEFGVMERLTSAADLYERAIVLSGLSKTHGLPGLRAGWLLVRDEPIRQALLNWKYYTTICPAAPTELLSIAALAAGERIMDRNKALIRQNIALVEPFFERWSDRFTWRRPRAGSVALVGLEAPSATEYCHNLAQTAGVLLLPGTFMGYEDRYVRFGFGRAGFAAALERYEAELEGTEWN